MFNFNHERWQLACQGLGTSKKICNILVNHIIDNKIDNMKVVQQLNSCITKVLKLQH